MFIYAGLFQESGAVDSLLPNITHLGINGFTHRFLNVSYLFYYNIYFINLQLIAAAK